MVSSQPKRNGAPMPDHREWGTFLLENQTERTVYFGVEGIQIRFSAGHEPAETPPSVVNISDDSDNTKTNVSSPPPTTTKTTTTATTSSSPLSSPTSNKSNLPYTTHTHINNSNTANYFLRWCLPPRSFVHGHFLLFPGYPDTTALLYTRIPTVPPYPQRSHPSPSSTPFQHQQPYRRGKHNRHLRRIRHASTTAAVPPHTQLWTVRYGPSHDLCMAINVSRTLLLFPKFEEPLLEPLTYRLFPEYRPTPNASIQVSLAHNIPASRIAGPFPHRPDTAVPVPAAHIHRYVPFLSHIQEPPTLLAVLDPQAIVPSSAAVHSIRRVLLDTAAPPSTAGAARHADIHLIPAASLLHGAAAWHTVHPLRSMRVSFLADTWEPSPVDINTHTYNNDNDNNNFNNNNNNINNNNNNINNNNTDKPTNTTTTTSPSSLTAPAGSVSVPIDGIIIVLASGSPIPDGVREQVSAAAGFPMLFVVTEVGRGSDIGAALQQREFTERDIRTCLASTCHAPVYTIHLPAASYTPSPPSSSSLSSSYSDPPSNTLDTLPSPPSRLQHSQDAVGQFLGRCIDLAVERAAATRHCTDLHEAIDCVTTDGNDSSVSTASLPSPSERVPEQHHEGAVWFFGVDNEQDAVMGAVRSSRRSMPAVLPSLVCIRTREQFQQPEAESVLEHTPSPSPATLLTRVVAMRHNLTGLLSLNRHHQHDKDPPSSSSSSSSAPSSPSPPPSPGSGHHLHTSHRRVVHRQDIVVLCVELSGRVLLTGPSGAFDAFAQAVKQRSPHMVLFVDRVDRPSGTLHLHDPIVNHIPMPTSYDNNHYNTNSNNNNNINNNNDNTLNTDDTQDPITSTTSTTTIKKSTTTSTTTNNTSEAVVYGDAIDMELDRRLCHSQHIDRYFRFRCYHCPSRDALSRPPPALDQFWRYTTSTRP